MKEKEREHSVYEFIKDPFDIKKKQHVTFYLACENKEASSSISVHFNMKAYHLLLLNNFTTQKFMIWIG